MSVKRHPALVPLSDDHHRALVLARETVRVGQGGDDAALATHWQELCEIFVRELEPHFRVEQDLLFAELEAAGEVALAGRAREEHARLRALANSPATHERAVAFGTLLHDHVRFEERELFPRAERVLAPAALEAVGRAARASHSGPVRR